MRIAALVALLALAGCGETPPWPAEKSTYVGEWQEKTTTLLITPDGAVRYKRVKGTMTTTVEAPLKRFEGDSFVVGVGPMTTKFVVTRPPHQDGTGWKMVVDGVELTRAAP